METSCQLYPKKQWQEGNRSLEEMLAKTIEGFEGLEAAQNAINTVEKKDAFAEDYRFLTRIWEALSPDKMLNLFNEDYKWLSQVYESVRPASDNIGKLLWFSLDNNKIMSLKHLPKIIN